ncbi:MAG: hypothetical protein CMJ35_08425 [Phycisphaerae bacterium]|nr:hypothetical protein [Phycisphaerae bacterium]MBM91623.1 hypothetical protein [Phycisphaerae bacterium]
MTRLPPEHDRIRTHVRRIGELSPRTAGRELEALENDDPACFSAVRDILSEASEDTRHPSSVPDSQDELSQLVRALAKEVSSPNLSLPSMFGRYRLLQLLGHGGSGTVYLAEQDLPRRPVALKLLQPGLDLSDAEFESAAVGSLTHPGLAHVYDAGLAAFEARPRDRLAYIAMEYIEGRPITSHCDEIGASTEERLKLLSGVAKTVAHLHQHGVVHGDIKPANILVDRQGRTRLLDFGVARIERLGMARESGIGGTRATTQGYALPDMGETPEHPGESADVFALGVLMGRVLCGKAFELGTPADRIRAALKAKHVRISLARPLSQLIAACITANDESRLGSAVEIADALGSCLSGAGWSPKGQSKAFRRLSLRVRSFATLPNMVILLLATGVLGLGLELRVSTERSAALDHHTRVLQASADDLQESIEATKLAATHSVDAYLATLDITRCVFASAAVTDPKGIDTVIDSIRDARVDSSPVKMVPSLQLLMLAEAQHAIGRDHEAAETASRAQQLLPENTSEHDRLMCRIDIVRARALSSLRRDEQAAEVLARWRTPLSTQSPPWHVEANTMLADAFIAMGKPDEALKLLEGLHAASISDLSQLPLETIAVIARAHRVMGDPDLAESMLRVGFQRQASKDPIAPSSEQLGRSQLVFELTALLSEDGGLSEAYSILTDLTDRLARNLPAKHTLLIEARARLARTCLNLSKLDEAERVLLINRAAINSRDQDDAALDRSLMTTLDLYRRRGQTATVVSTMRELIALKTQRHGTSVHPDVLRVRLELAALQQAIQTHEQTAEALPGLHELLEDAQTGFGLASAQSAQVYELLAVAYERADDLAEAVRYARLAIRIGRHHGGFFPHAQRITQSLSGHAPHDQDS